MSSRSGTAVFWGGLTLLLVLVAVLAAGNTNNERLDPRGVSGEGAKALVELMEAFDADVELDVDLPTSSHAVAVLLSDGYGLTDGDTLEAWVRAGGTLLVTDPTSPLTPRLVDLGQADGADICDVAALRDVSVIVGATTAYRAPPDGDVCFGGAVAVDPLGEGTIVSLGGVAPLLNDQLDEGDNAIFAVSILAPNPGVRVAFLDSRRAQGPPDESLVDLIADPVWVLLAQLAVGFVLLAWWQARRLGAPVSEPVIVQIEGSELAAARGRLLQSTRQPAGVAAELRTYTGRQLAARLGLPTEVSTEVLARRVGVLAGMAESDVVALLETRPIQTDDALHQLSVGLAGLRDAVIVADASVRTNSVAQGEPL